MMLKFPRSIYLYLLLFIHANAQAMLFDSHTMRDYCQQYENLISLQDNVDHYQAGLCIGYISSNVELMSYSEQLCQRDQLNIDHVIEGFITKASENSHAVSAIQVVVEVLETMHGCE